MSTYDTAVAPVVRSIQTRYVPQMLCRTDGALSSEWLDIAGPQDSHYWAQSYIDSRPDNLGDNMRVVERTTVTTDRVVLS